MDTDDPEMTNYSTDKLADLIDKRHRCLTSLRDLSAEQSGLIADGNISALLRSFATKNHWIVGLQSIERELAPFHAEDAERRVWRTLEKRQQCATQAAECKMLLDEVMQLEMANEKAMTQRRDQVAVKLQTVHVASAARTAYQSQQDAITSRPHSTSHWATNNTAASRLDIQSEAT